MRRFSPLFDSPFGTGSARARQRALACPSPTKNASKGRCVTSKRFPAYGLLLGATLATWLGMGYAVGQQPHMPAAVGFLQSARRTGGGCGEQGRSPRGGDRLDRPGDRSGSPRHRGGGRLSARRRVVSRRALDSARDAGRSIVFLASPSHAMRQRRDAGREDKCEPRRRVFRGAVLRRKADSAGHTAAITPSEPARRIRRADARMAHSPRHCP